MGEVKNLKWIDLLAYLFLLTASYVFTKGNMFQTGEMPLFTPAPYTFSIWILIYILLGVWVIIAFFRPNKSDYEVVGYWFAITLVLAGMSILVPTNLSVLFIVGALIGTIMLYVKVREEGNLYSEVVFSLLLGWLSVATIADISIVLKNLGFTTIFGFGEITWTIVMLAVGTILAILFSIKEDNSIYPLVFIWGYIGIAVTNKEIPEIVRMTLVMSFILAVVVGCNWYAKKVKLMQ